MEGELQRCVGRNLRRLREAREISQEDFAERLDVHRTYVGGLERGERNVTLKTLERLAERLGVEPLVLLVEQPPSATTASGTASAAKKSAAKKSAAKKSAAKKSAAKKSAAKKSAAKKSLKPQPAEASARRR